jgi:hypothetical protein
MKATPRQVVAVAREAMSEDVFDAGREWFMNERSIVDDRALDRFVLSVAIDSLPAEDRNAILARIRRGP